MSEEMQTGMREAAAPSTYGELISVLDHLGFLVRETRRIRRYSLRAAAEQIGTVDFTTLSRIENGENTTLTTAVSLLRWIERNEPSAE